MSSGCPSWMHDLSPNLRACATTVKGTEAKVFPKSAALDVAAALGNSAEVCLGGDLWIPEGAHYRASVENWYVIPLKDEPLEDLVARSWDYAHQFIRCEADDDWMISVAPLAYLRRVREEGRGLRRADEYSS